MKKLLAILGLGIIAISCGTKESSMSTSNTDSAVISTTPDTIKVDSATTVK